jgi:hypothetical protein
MAVEPHVERVNRAERVGSNRMCATCSLETVLAQEMSGESR